jgi:hypothetical protein
LRGDLVLVSVERRHVMAKALQQGVHLRVGSGEPFVSVVSVTHVGLPSANWHAISFGKNPRMAFSCLL